jgi:hypothetical protein
MKGAAAAALLMFASCGSVTPATTSADAAAEHLQDGNTAAAGDVAGVDVGRLEDGNTVELHPDAGDAQVAGANCVDYQEHVSFAICVPPRVAMPAHGEPGICRIVLPTDVEPPGPTGPFVWGCKVATLCPPPTCTAYGTCVERCP